MDSSTQHRLRLQSWQEIYDAALQETSIPKLFALVELAEATILLRRDALMTAPQSAAELAAIEAALRDLALLKRERLHF
jgi:hypothetical protein